MALIDLTLGLKPQSTALLHALAVITEGCEPFDNAACCFETAAHYNGRERGYSLSIRRSCVDMIGLVIVFGECRASDQLFVEHAERRLDINPPEHGGLSEISYQRRKEFGYGQFDKAARYIARLAARYVKTGKVA